MTFGHRCGFPLTTIQHLRRHRRKPESVQVAGELLNLDPFRSPIAEQLIYAGGQSPAASAILPKEVIAHLSLKTPELSRDRATVSSSLALASSPARCLGPLYKVKLCFI